MMYLLLALTLSFNVFAQEELDSIEISESSLSDDIVGVSSDSAPISNKTYSSEVLEEQRIKTSSDLSILDASVTNNYSGSGYWDSLNIRGFGVDNRLSYFRDGLRINAQTYIPMENKESVEVIKGVGAFQNSSAAPSGAVNYRIKRPKDIRDFRLELTERGGHLSHLDLGSTKGKLQFRFNVLNENIKSPYNFNDGYRNLLAAAFSYQLSSRSLLEAEVEWSRRAQQSLSAQGFWGTSLPAPRSELNLNNQRWAKSVEFESLLFSIRYTHELNDSWHWGISALRQNSVTDDRMSYAFGCSAENNWTSFCRDGSFDVYDYRSEDEKRLTHSARLNLSGKIEGEVRQELSFNLRYSHLEEKLGNQAYNYVGEGNQSGRRLPHDASKTDPSTNLDEETLELFVVDQLSRDKWHLWLGGNFQHRYRSTWKHDLSEKNKTDNQFFTPWLALTYEEDNRSYYISYSQTKESLITPNKPDYKNPSALLPDQTTHQYEVGIKAKNYSTALFYLKRPRLFDDGEDFKIDGHFEQYGWENNAHWKWKNSNHHLSFMYLHVKQFASGAQGKTAPNIPDLALRYIGAVELKYFTLGTRVQYESLRYASFDNELSVPDWIKWDFFIEKKMKNFTVKGYIDNAFQKRFWKESPIQYGHHYLYQGQARRVGILAQYQF